MDGSWFYGDIVRATLNKSRGKKTVTIPVSRRLGEVFVEDGNQVFYGESFTINYTDRVLVEIMAEAKVLKHISFHCSMRTFACVGLEIGIPAEVIQAVLGHSNIRETQIYVKIQAQGGGGMR